jgi:hypothetical protein
MVNLFSSHLTPPNGPAGVAVACEELSGNVVNNEAQLADLASRGIHFVRMAGIGYYAPEVALWEDPSCRETYWNKFAAVLDRAHAYGIQLIVSWNWNACSFPDLGRGEDSTVALDSRRKSCYNAELRRVPGCGCRRCQMATPATDKQGRRTPDRPCHPAATLASRTADCPSQLPRRSCSECGRPSPRPSIATRLKDPNRRGCSAERTAA